MLQKNEYMEIEIDAINAEGEGIGRINGITVFVEGGLPGDLLEILIVNVKKTYCYGKLIKIIRPSSDRVQPICPVFKQCGGCHLQHLDYARQLEYKQSKLINALQRIGGLRDVSVEKTIGMEKPFFYRNKAQFPVAYNRADNSVATGFYAKRSHFMIPVTKCFIQNEICEDILNIIEGFANEFKIKPYDEKAHTGLLRHVLLRTGYYTGEIMVCLVINGDRIPHEKELIKRLCKIKGIKSITVNCNTDKTNVITNKSAEKNRVLFGEAYITDYIGELHFQISPLSFFQVNPIQTKVLYETVANFAKIKENETVFDLYCGVGSISLFVARTAKAVYGIESISDAINDAEVNASANNITNVEFLTGMAEEMIRELVDTRGIKPDVIILDPPRKGCDRKLIDVLTETSAERIVYVSCEPSTLARDIKLLTDGGYKLVKAQPIDCFPQTVNVECCCLLEHV